MNGLILDTAYAKIGAVGQSVNKPLERKGTIITTVYFGGEEASISDQTIKDEENIKAEIVNFPEVEWSRSLSNGVSMVARTLAESKHCKNYLEEINGALFIDGSIYPLGLIYWIVVSKSNIDSPASTWNKPKEIVKNYIEIIEAQKRKDLPVIGIVKTSSSKHLLEALEEKTLGSGNGFSNLPWNTDHQFMSEVLHNNAKDELTYTSWFIHKKTKLKTGDSSKKYEVLEEFDLELGSPKDYRRTFFYIRLPRTGAILRAETPYFMVKDKEDREMIQNKVLSEVSKNLDIPKSISRADRLANISRNNRDKLRKGIKKTLHYYDYNWDGRWDDLEENYWS